MEGFHSAEALASPSDGDADSLLGSLPAASATSSRTPSVSLAEAPRTHDAELAAHWQQLFRDWGRSGEVEASLRENEANAQMERMVIAQGIPPSHRGDVWMTISGAGERRATNPGTYEAYINGVTKEVRERIELDARRLGRLPGMATNLVNNGGIGLADPSIAQSVRVVSAYCAYDHSLGYVQGMLYIALLLIVVLEHEEKAFWLFVTVMESYGLREFLHPQSSTLFDTLRELDRAMELQLPNLRRHLTVDALGSIPLGQVQQQCLPAMYAVECFTCFYVTSLSFPTLIRVWDMLLMRQEGILIKVMVAIMTLLERELLETSTETVFATLKTGMAAIDGDNLLPLLAEPALPGLLNARCTVC